MFHGSESEPREFSWPRVIDSLSDLMAAGAALRAQLGSRQSKSTRAGDTQIFFDSKPLPWEREVVVGRDYQAMTTMLSTRSTGAFRESMPNFIRRQELAAARYDDGAGETCRSAPHVMMHALVETAHTWWRRANIFVRGEHRHSTKRQNTSGLA